MQSKAKTVTAYLSQVPANRRAALTKLRKLCVQSLVGYEEVMEYGLPGYRKNGKVEIAFASQKNHVSLYVLKRSVLDAHRTALGRASVGKGCIRYRNLQNLDFALIEKLLIATRASGEDPC